MTGGGGPIGSVGGHTSPAGSREMLAPIWNSRPLPRGSTYVASVWMPAGHYAFAGGFFSAGGVDHAPIHLLQDGIDGVNGAYRYNAQGFPTTTYNSANYWVDVVFENASGPDVTPPAINKSVTNQ